MPNKWQCQTSIRQRNSIYSPKCCFDYCGDKESGEWMWLNVCVCDHSSICMFLLFLWIMPCFCNDVERIRFTKPMSIALRANTRSPAHTWQKGRRVGRWVVCGGGENMHVITAYSWLILLALPNRPEWQFEKWKVCFNITHTWTHPLPGSVRVFVLGLWINFLPFGRHHLNFIPQLGHQPIIYLSLIRTSAWSSWEQLILVISVTTPRRTLTKVSSGNTHTHTHHL